MQIATYIFRLKCFPHIYFISIIQYNKHIYNKNYYIMKYAIRNLVDLNLTWVFAA